MYICSTHKVLNICTDNENFRTLIANLALTLSAKLSFQSVQEFVLCCPDVLL